MSLDDSNPKTSVFHWNSTIEILEECLIALRQIAPVATPAQIRDVVPSSAGELSRLVLCELIKFDLAAAAEYGIHRDLNFYLTEFADELPTEEMPADLVLEEMQSLREAGNDPVISGYIQRFPHLREILPNWTSNLTHETCQSLSSSKGAPPELAIGSVIADFRILRHVGHGAFANVYLALQETLQRLVALKVSQKGSEEPQTLSQLDHPNIVRVYDERNQTDPPLRLLYMQFIGGGTLADCLTSVSELPSTEKNGQCLIDSIDRHLKMYGLELPLHADSNLAVAKLDWVSTVAWVGMQLAGGLDYAHRLGVIHRDIKPANIILAADATPKLADFNVSFSGIAGRAGAAAFFGGSLAYMSPEQLDVANPVGQGTTAKELDGRSDLFSLGLMLWEMLHGSRPWTRQSFPNNWTEAMQLECQLRTQPLPPKRDEATIAKRSGYRVLDHALRQSLQLDPNDRPASGRQMAKALRLALHPRVALRLFPQFAERRHWLAQLPPWLVLIAATLAPNMIAAVFNFIYNSSQIISKYPELWPKFLQVSTVVNLIFFPIGIATSMGLIIAFVNRLHPSPKLGTVPDRGVHSYWNLGHHVALCCGILWVIAGFVFPLLLVLMYTPFQWMDAIHFFSSLTICGGVAMVYPFFLLTILNLKLYYPQSVAARLADPEFAEWGKRLRRLARVYLLAAAAIPLFALSLLVLTPEVPRQFLLIAVLTTAIGYAASFLAVQYIDDFVQDITPFMASESEKPLDVSP